MSEIYQKHIAITEKIKDEILHHKVVFPAYYGKLYAQIAGQYNIALEPHELLGSEMLDQKMVRHILSLSAFAEEAIEAIHSHDETLLQHVLEETKKLHHEIAELQKIVYEDTLTRSHNRKWFEDLFLDESKTIFVKAGTLVMVDLNRFKRVNDEFGHIVGDKVLIHLALKLNETGGQVVRFGGDEFLVLFDETVCFSEIELKMQSVLAYFKKIAFKVEKKEFKITFAYGMNSFEKNNQLSAILDSSDKAMYQFKKGARVSSVK